MKKFFGIVLALVMSVSLATVAFAGDVKVGGELESYAKMVDGADSDLDYETEIKLKLKQSIDELTSWGITFKYEYTNSETSKFDDPEKIKLEDAFLKFGFNPLALKVGRYESKWDQDHDYFGAEWNGKWQERNTLGIELSGNTSKNFNLTGGVFVTDSENKTAEETHYGIKGTWTLNSLLLSGAFYSMKENTSNFMVQGVYDMEPFAFYGLARLYMGDEDPDENEFCFGAGYFNEKFALLTDIQFIDLDDGDSETNVLLEGDYFMAKKTKFYAKYLIPEDDGDTFSLGFLVKW